MATKKTTTKKTSTQKSRSSARGSSAPREFVRLTKFGGEARELPVSEGTTLGALLEQAQESGLEEYGTFVNGEAQGLDYELSDGDIVALVPGVKAG